jgi:hypothetical protein
MGPEERVPSHFESGEIAAFLDGSLPPAERSRIEAHLADCDDCRTELIQVADLLRTRPRRRGWYVPVTLAAAAAAVLIVLIWPRQATESPGAPAYREPAITSSPAPALIAPRGTASTARTFIWTGVPHADRYYLALFDETGQKVWETQTGDTTAALPASISLHQGASYFWKVEARTGWDRWVDSDLKEFSIGSPRP